MAFYNALYKEAVEKLRVGELVSITGDGAKKAAQAIEDYVTDQFLKRFDIAKVDYPKRYHDAMEAFLYQEAVSMLANGKLGVNILGEKELADAIERWVKIEFRKRMYTLK